MDEPLPAYTGDEPYYFVSYAHRDTGVVTPALIELQGLGLNIWYDEGINPGSAWREELAAAVRGAKGFIFLATKHSVSSENCRNEINFALDINSPFLAIHLENLQLPDGLQFSLNTRQALMRYDLTDSAYANKIRLFDTGTKTPRKIHTSSPATTPATAQKFKWPLILATIVIALGAAIGYFYQTQSRQEINSEPAATQADVKLDPASIAVLPLKNLSGDAADDPFVLGIHDDLLTHIAQVSALHTISRTSVMQYQHSTSSIATIGMELGVGSILEGSIQRSAEQVRINLKLIDVTTDQTLWSEVYDRELTTANLFAVQGEIAAAVASALKVTLLMEEKDAISKAPTLSMAAYEQYLLGRHEWNKRTEQSITLSRDYFASALKIDPQFVPAMSGLADAYIQLVEHGTMRGQTAYPLAQQLLDRAMLIDDSVSEVWASLGSLKSNTGQFEAAGEAFEKALKLNPDNASAWMWYGEFLNNPIVRRYKEGLAAYQRAEQLEPMSKPLNLNLIAAYHRRGYFEVNKKHHLRLAAIDPDNAIRYLFYIAGNNIPQGKLAQAIISHGELMMKDPYYFPAYSNLVRAYSLLGDFEQARKWAALGNELAPGRNIIDPIRIAQQDYDEWIGQVEKFVNSLPDRANVGLSLLSGLFQLHLANEDTANAKPYLDEYLTRLDGRLIVRPGNYESRLNLYIAYFWQQFGSKAEQDRGEKLAREIRDNLEYMEDQGFHQAQTYFIRAFAEGLVGNESAMLHYLDLAIDQGWLDLALSEPFGQLTTTENYQQRVARIQEKIEVERNLLASANLPAFNSILFPDIEVDPEILSYYEGYYTNGDLRYYFGLDQTGQFTMTSGQTFTDELKAINLNEFYRVQEKGSRYEFHLDQNRVVTHILVKNTGRSSVLKVAEPPPRSIRVPRPLLQNYVGQYAFTPLPSNTEASLSDLTLLDISLDDNGDMWAETQHRYQSRLKIEPFTKDEFFIPGHMGSYQFVGNDSGSFDVVFQIEGTKTVFLPR